LSYQPEAEKQFGWRQEKFKLSYLIIKCFSFIALVLLGVATLAQGADFDLAARATNEFGIDLQHRLATREENLCLSPYSIQNALAMTFAGADGETRAEMGRVLHFPTEGEAVHASFASLNLALVEMAKTTATIAAESKKRGGPSEPITLTLANRLFAQTGYNFRDSFRQLIEKFYGAPFAVVDFKKFPEQERQRINDWAAEQTRNRIRDLIPGGGLNALTRLVLANAIYLKAPWQSDFSESATKPKPFHLKDGAVAEVPTMTKIGSLGYSKGDGYVAVALPYTGGELQFLVLLPDEVSGLPVLETKLSAGMFAGCAKMETREIDLSLPKFKLEPPTIALSQQLRALGMKSAFDEPPGSANFDGIAPRQANDYLAISEVFHKTFIAVDEKGTEAAAATAVSMKATTVRVEQPKPIEVKIDHPFFYAIQHVPSGACLFVGRIVDPR
jgi:serpin B